jgi:hypothetical protein
MIRTQIQLTEEQVQAVKHRAAEEGVSMAEFIRRAVQERLTRTGRDDAWQRFWSVVGKYRSHEGDLSERHDEYLAEAVEARWREPS